MPRVSTLTALAPPGGKARRRARLECACLVEYRGNTAARARQDVVEAASVRLEQLVRYRFTDGHEVFVISHALRAREGLEPSSRKSSNGIPPNRNGCFRCTAGGKPVGVMAALPLN